MSSNILISFSFHYSCKISKFPLNLLNSLFNSIKCNCSPKNQKFSICKCPGQFDIAFENLKGILRKSKKKKKLEEFLNILVYKISVLLHMLSDYSKSILIQIHQYTRKKMQHYILAFLSTLSVSLQILLYNINSFKFYPIERFFVGP